MKSAHRGLVTLLLLALPAAVAAQGFSMLKPLMPRYDLLGFHYESPKGDGWRQLELASNFVHLVYVLDLGEGKLDTRAEFAAEAHEIPDPAMVPDVQTLTLQSFEQRRKEREANLIAHSKISLLDGAESIYTYTLISRLDEEEFAEVFFVKLAPDRTAYLAAKLRTADVKYEDEAYFQPILDSLATLSYSKAAEQDATTERPDGASKPIEAGDSSD